MRQTRTGGRHGRTPREGDIHRRTHHFRARSDGARRRGGGGLVSTRNPCGCIGSCTMTIHARRVEGALAVWDVLPPATICRQRMALAGPTGDLSTEVSIY